MSRYHLIYQDSDALIVNKPPGMLTIPDRFGSKGPSMLENLSLRYDKVLPVHRLDYETSGVLLFARNEAFHTIMNGLFESRKIEKLYWVICLSPREKEGVIDIPIRENLSYRGTYEAHPDGKPALSEYRVLEELGRYALVEVRILTGRTHQVRVHMQSIHAPLFVDSKYGLQKSFYLSEIKKYRQKEERKERPLLSRSSLHARYMKFNVPGRADSYEFEAPLPKDFKAALNQLRKVFS
jgi:23S rRNA pseudouridine955/2504/2580 synthase/23S rRNA pseudouridine1911/1915/1917 synthase